MLSLDNSDDDLFTITLSDDELNDDTSGADNISGLLLLHKIFFKELLPLNLVNRFFVYEGLIQTMGPF